MHRHMVTILYTQQCIQSPPTDVQHTRYILYTGLNRVYTEIYTQYTQAHQGRGGQVDRGSQIGQVRRGGQVGRGGQIGQGGQVGQHQAGILRRVYTSTSVYNNNMHIRVNILCRSGTQAYSNLRFSTQPKPDYQPSGGSALNLSLMFSTTTMEVQHKN